MYIKIDQKYKCKNCGSEIEPEHIQKGSIFFRRCIICEHESSYFEFKTTDRLDSNFYILDYKPIEY